MTQQDTTARHAAQRQIQALTHELTLHVARLEQANAELQAFTHTVSHDLRAPLRAIQGFAHALLEDHAGGLGPEGRECARRVAGAAMRMDQLIQDLLAYSRLSRTDLRLVSVNVGDAIADAVEQLGARIRETGATVETPGHTPEVLGHRRTLAQVCANLLTNALTFVGEGATPHVRVRTVSDDQSVRIVVEDNGIGIAPQHHERIFRVFERLHGSESFPGTGIGLAIVRKGVERMGGTVGVESEPGAGSRFWLALPRAGGDSMSAAP